MDKNLALETLKSFVENTDNVITKNAILALHPELKESEDEKIMEEIISFIKGGTPYYCPNSMIRQKWATYLEKQKDTYSPNFPKSCSDCPTEIQSIIDKEFGIYGRDENDEPLNKCGDWKKGMVLNGSAIWGLVKLGINWQKEHPTSGSSEKPNIPWSKEDEEMFACIIDDVKEINKTKKYKHQKEIGEMEIDWLKNRLKSLYPSHINHTVWHNASDEKPTKLPIIHIWYHGNRVNAVTHEDTCLQAELDDINFQPDDKWAYVEDLLNVQPHWKPSEEQMEALKMVFYNRPIGSAELNSLESLYNDLRKL